MGGMSMGILESDSDKCDLDLKLPSPSIERCTSGARGEDVVSQLRIAFDKSLRLKDAEGECNLDSPLDENGGGNMAAEVSSEKSRVWEHDKTTCNGSTPSPVKCLCKSATFPVTDYGSATSADSKDKAHASGPKDKFSCVRSMSLPVLRKIVPAIKGSREKEGLTLKKLSVSWAPDVYDPPPSSVSHLPKKKTNQQYRNNKKYSKGKQKSKSSRGSSKKDKKHHREELSLGRKSTMEPIAAVETEKKFAMDPVAVSGMEKKFVMDPIPLINYNTTVELMDFDNNVDSPDSNCGSSFLRKSRGTLHFSYTETT